MQLEVIGIGGAGCRIADAIRAAESADRSFVADVFAFDTDGEALPEYTDVPEFHHYQYGQDVGLDAGLDGELQRGLEVGEEYVAELERVLDRGTPAAADGFLITVGLGGATGGGTVPALVATLQRRYDEPVYVLATLPADREFEPAVDSTPEAGRADAPPETGGGSSEPASAIASEPANSPSRPNAAANAIETLERLDGLASAIIPFDNERWLRTGEELGDGRNRCNRELARRVTAVFAVSVASGDSVAETVIDASDIGRVMGNETAVVSLGYGEQPVETGGSRFGLGLFATEPDIETSSAVSAVETVVRKGIHDTLTLECERDAAERALLIVGGPPAWLNRRAIAEGRGTLESTIGGRGILGGDAPRPDGEAVFAAVVLADVEPVDRLEELRAATQEQHRV